MTFDYHCDILNVMEQYAKSEIEEALEAFESLISKCEKAREKLKDGSPQRTLINKRIKAFKMAVSLLENLQITSSR